MDGFLQRLIRPIAWQRTACLSLGLHRFWIKGSATVHWPTLLCGENGTLHKLSNPGNVADREIRTTMLPFERKAYSDAVLCLTKKPSRLAAIDPSLAPGSKSR